MAEKFEAWARLAVEQMQFPWDRRQVKQELLDHLEDRREEYIGRGLAAQEAEGQALAAMGDAVETGKLLNKVHRPWLGWLWLASKWAACLLTAALVWNFWVSSYEGSLILGLKDLWRWSVSSEEGCSCQYSGRTDLAGGWSVEEGDYTLTLDHGQVGVTQLEQGGSGLQLALGFQVDTDQWWQTFPLGLHRLRMQTPDGASFGMTDRQGQDGAVLMSLDYTRTGLTVWSVHLFVQYECEEAPAWVRFYIPDTGVDVKVWTSGEVTP